MSCQGLPSSPSISSFLRLITPYCPQICWFFGDLQSNFELCTDAKPPPWPGPTKPNHCLKDIVPLYTILGANWEAIVMIGECWVLAEGLSVPRISSVFEGWSAINFLGGWCGNSAPLLFSPIPSSISDSLLSGFFSSLLGWSLMEDLSPTVSRKGKSHLGVENDVLPPPKSQLGLNPPSEAMPPLGATTIIGDCSHQKAEKKHQSARKQRLNMEKLKGVLDGVEANIKNLSLTSVYATIIGEPVAIKTIRKKIQFDWKFMSGGFQIIPMRNNWLEIRFDKAEDCKKVWEGRPFHVAKQLMLIRPWRLDFDPMTESITTIDVWIRIPGLPVKYVSNKVLADLVDGNNLGTVIRVAAFGRNGARYRFPRICVSVDITKIKERKIKVLNEFDQLEEYPVWFDDLSDGCGSCGAADHLFEDCPQHLAMEGSVRAGQSYTVGEEQNDTAENRDSSSAGDWKKVAAKKKPPTLRFGHSKQALLQLFGANAEEPSDSSTSKSSNSLSDQEMQTEVVPTDVVPIVPEVTLNVATSVAALVEPLPADAATSNILVASPSQALSTNENFNSPAYDPALSDSIFAEAFDLDMVDYEDEPITASDCAAIPASFHDDDLSRMLENYSTSVEVSLQAIDAPISASTGFLGSVAPAMSPNCSRLEAAAPSASKSGSSKRKMSFDDGDTACSDMGAGSSKRFHV